MLAHRDCSNNLRWLCHPVGHRFVVDEDWINDLDCDEEDNRTIRFTSVSDKSESRKKKDL